MKRIIIFFAAIVIAVSCSKEKEEMVFSPRNYTFLKNEFIGEARSYNSKGLFNSNVDFKKDFFYMSSNTCVFMKDIELSSESLATFYFNDREDSVLTVNYIQDGRDITFNRIIETDPIPATIHFIESENKIETVCTEIKFEFEGSEHSNLKIGELSQEQLQKIIDYLQANDTIYVQQFNVTYERK
jgi:hypothetical protein